MEEKKFAEELREGIRNGTYKFRMKIQLITL